MEEYLLQKQINSLLYDLKTCIETEALSSHDIYLLKAEIDKLLYDCLYHKSNLLS